MFVFRSGLHRIVLGANRSGWPLAVFDSAARHLRSRSRALSGANRARNQQDTS